MSLVPLYPQKVWFTISLLEVTYLALHLRLSIIIFAPGKGQASLYLHQFHSSRISEVRLFRL